MRFFIVRHGKAKRDSPTGRDEDRPLNERGERQAQWLGETLAQLPMDDRPTIIFSSPAARARDTAKVFRKHLSIELRFEDALRLGASLDDTINFAHNLIAGREQPILVGHNPTLEALVEFLTGESDCEMRTGEAAVLQIPVAGVAEGRCRVVGRIRLPE